MKIKKLKHNQLYRSSWVLIAILCTNLIVQLLAIIMQDSLEIEAYSLAVILVITDIVICYLGIKKIIYPYYQFHTAMNDLITNDTIIDIENTSLPRQLPDSEELYNSIVSYKEKTNQLYTLELLKNQAELNALQSQINPHFLYNTIDAIRSQVLIAGESEVADILENLSNFFRYSIGSSTTLISIEEELVSIDGYIKIIQFRFPNKFILIKRIDIDDSSIMDYKIPKLTLQPLIENAISHGLEIKPGTGSITLRIKRTDKHMQLSVEDNGIGMNVETLDKLNNKLSIETNNPTIQKRTAQNKKTGIGLTNVNQRIKSIYGSAYGLNVTSLENKGTCINILLPMEQGR